MRGLLPLLSTTTTTSATTKLFPPARAAILRAPAALAPASTAAAAAIATATATFPRAFAAPTHRNTKNHRRAMASSASAADATATIDYPALGLSPNPGEDVAVLGGGCFWCIEAPLNGLKGVSSAISGYAAGNVDRPTYQQVCTGTTGHNEVVAVYFDPKVVDFETILNVFFALHDPTTLNQQGNDVGTQYRSGVYYIGEAQRAVAEKVMREVAEAKVWGNKPLTTELVPLQAGVGRFHPGEAYHQRFYENNPNHGYCQFAVAPKMAKLRSKFAHLVK